MAKRHFLKPNSTEGKMVRSLDKLADYDEFTHSLPGQLRRDVMSGQYTAEQLRIKYLPLIQARQIATAILAPDNNHSNSASQAILDRVEGKAKERHEHTHKLEKLKEEELDAMLLSELDELDVAALEATPVAEPEDEV